MNYSESDIPPTSVPPADRPILWELGIWSRATKYKGRQTYYHFIKRQVDKLDLIFDPDTNSWKPYPYKCRTKDLGQSARRDALLKWSKYQRYDKQMTLFEYAKSHVDNGEIFDRHTSQWVKGVRHQRLDPFYDPFDQGNGVRSGIMPI